LGRILPKPKKKKKKKKKKKTQNKEPVKGMHTVGGTLGTRAAQQRHRNQHGMCEIADSTATVPYSTVLLFCIVQYTTVLYCKLVYSTVLYLLQPSVQPRRRFQGEAVIGREHVGLPECSAPHPPGTQTGCKHGGRGDPRTSATPYQREIQGIVLGEAIRWTGTAPSLRSRAEQREVLSTEWDWEFVPGSAAWAYL